MMKLNTLYVVFAMVTIGLAGCIGGGGDDLQQTDDDPSGPAEVTEDTGGISGTVTDEEGLPVEGAQVALQSPGKEGLETTTDESGFFSFSNVAPGTWQLFLQKLGFESIGRQVSINAGQVTEVQEVISTVPVEEPHITTLVGEGVVQCSIRVYPGVPTTGASGLPMWVTGVAICGLPEILGLPPIPVGSPDKFLVQYLELPENINEIYLEMTWESTQATGRGLSVVVEHDGHPNDADHTFGDHTGPSPLFVHADEARMQNVTETSGEDCFDNSCDLMTRTFAEANTTEFYLPDLGPLPVLGDNPDKVDIGFVFDQRFTQYVSLFHFQTKPDTFSKLPNA